MNAGQITSPTWTAMDFYPAFQASRLTYTNGVVADEALPATDSNTAILRTYGLDAIAIVTARPDEVTLPGIGLLHQHEPDELLYFPVEKPY